MASHTPSDLLSSKEAAHIAGFAPDYMTRLCRAKKIEATQIGRTWFVERAQLQKFLEDEKVRKSNNVRSLAQKREQEYRAAVRERASAPLTKSVRVEEIVPAFTASQHSVEVWIDTEPVSVPRVRGHAFAFASALVVIVLSLPFSVSETRTRTVAVSADMVASVSSSLFVHAHEHAKVTLYEGGLAPLGVLAVLNDIPSKERVRNVSPNEEASFARSFFRSVTIIGSTLAGISDVILRVHEQGVRGFVHESRRIPSRVIASIHTVGMHTALFIHNAPSALASHRWSTENTVLSVVGHLALVYDAARASLRSVYEYAPAQSFFAGAASSMKAVKEPLVSE